MNVKVRKQRRVQENNTWIEFQVKSGRSILSRHETEESAETSAARFREAVIKLEKEKENKVSILKRR